MKGKLISIEGGDGGGKDTHADLLIKYLTDKGLDVVVTREPGGTALGEAIRKILLDPDLPKGPEAELFLYLASRSDHSRILIKPALEAGKIVITKRLHDSSTAYQGYAGGVPLDFVAISNKIALDGLLPDLTIYIDVPPETGLEKATYDEFGKPDWQEKKGHAFQAKLREGYLEIAKQEPDRVKVIKYRDGDIEGMQNEIRVLVDNLLGEK